MDAVHAVVEKLRAAGFKASAEDPEEAARRFVRRMHERGGMVEEDDDYDNPYNEVANEFEELGDEAVEREDWEEAADHYLAAIDACRPGCEEDDELLASCRNDLMCMLRADESDLKRIEQISPQAIDFALEKHDKEAMLETLKIQSELYYRMEKYYTSVGIVQKAHELWLKSDEKGDGDRSFFYWQGRSHDVLEEWIEARECFEQALPWAETVDEERQLDCLYRLSDTMVNLEVADSFFFFFSCCFRVVFASNFHALPGRARSLCYGSQIHKSFVAVGFNRRHLSGSLCERNGVVLL